MFLFLPCFKPCKRKFFQVLSSYVYVLVPRTEATARFDDCADGVITISTTRESPHLFIHRVKNNILYYYMKPLQHFRDVFGPGCF